jgi:trehalose 6-phosphate phosphatase
LEYNLVHLFTIWDKIVKQLGDSKTIILLSDFDGTLTPIVSRPELAILPESTTKLMQALIKDHCIILGVISGRALVDLKKLVGLNGIIYAGNHGLEIEGPKFSFLYPLPDVVKSSFNIIYQVLKKTLISIPGVIIENKGLTLSVHYRQVDENQVTNVKHTFKQVTESARLLGMVNITTGKKVIEVRPVVNWNKGKAISLIIKEYGQGRKSGKVPFYIGDDQTDEDAFIEINRYADGISIFVGDNQAATRARYFLNSAFEVTQLFNILHEIRGGKSR